MAPLVLTVGTRNYSSWSLRPWLLMRALNFEFETRDVDVLGRGVSPALKPFSPSGLVPVLSDGGFAVWDSLAIMEYLADIAPEKGVWPADARARARARCIAAEMHSGFGDLRAGMPMNIKMRLPAGAPPPMSPGIAACIERIEAIWAEARTGYGVPSGAGPWLFGAFSAADAMYAPVAWRFRTYGVRPANPIAAEYMDALLVHDGMKEWQAAALAEGAARAIKHYDDAARAAGCVEEPRE
jgi:glutathione S-transferase